MAADPQTKVYGEANPALTFVYSGFLGTDDKSVLDTEPTCSTTASQFSDVGSYPITCAGGLDNNYVFAYTASTLAITPADQTITFGALADKTYGDPSFNSNSSASSGLTVVLNSTTPTVCSPAGNMVTILGVGTCTIVASQSGNGNWNAATPITQSFNIAKAVLTVTANDVTKPYGTANPPLTASITGFKYSDTTSVVSGAPTLSTTAGNASPVGAYPISIGIGSLAALNYTFTLMPGTLTIEQAQTSLALTSSLNPSNLGDSVTFTATLSGYGFGTAPGSIYFVVDSDTTPVLLNLGHAQLTLSTLTAGIHYVTAYYGGNSNLLFTLATLAGGQVVNKLAQSITFAPLANKNYGDLPFLVSATGGGSSNPVTFTSTTTSVCTAGGTNGATITILAFGSCTIKADQAGDATYSAAPSVSQSFTVNKATLTITANSTSKTYGNTVTFAGTEFSTSGLVGSDSVASVTLTSAGGAASAAVASYPIVPSAAVGSGLGNYTISYLNGSLTVNKATLTITADNQWKTYGSANPAFTFTPTGFVNGDTSASALSGSPSLTTTATAASPVGPYTITAAQGTLAAANYTFSFVNGTLTVAKAHLTVAANNKTRAYGVANPSLDAAITGFVNGETIAVVSGSPSCSTSATITSPVGTSAITCTVGSLTATNYDFPTFNPGTLTITQATTTAAVSSSVNPSNLGQSVTFTATITGFGGGAATGSVQFKDGASNIGSPVTVASGQAQYSTSALTAGSHSITAVYTGDSNLIGSTSGALTQTVNASLSVTSVVPSSVGRGAVAFPVTINGTGFVSGSYSLTISGSGVTGTATYRDATHLNGFITITSGASTVSRNVTVTQGSASATCTGCLTVTAAPTIFSLSPSSRGQGAMSQNVVISGSNFLSGSWATSSVVFSGIGITVNSVTRTDSAHLTVNISIAAGAATGARNVTVVNIDGGRDIENNSFTVNPAPTVSSLSPSSRGQGAASQNIVITGTNFLSGSWPTSSVAFSGAGITVNSVTRTNSTHLTVNVTISATATIGSSSVTVTNLDAGVGSLASAFTVNARPTILSLSPNSRRHGLSNQTIIIAGTGFVSGATVAFSGSGITVNSVTRNSATQLTVVISLSGSAATGLRNVTVTNPDAGFYTLSNGFTVLT